MSFLLSLGDFAVVTVSNDFRALSSLIDDVDGVTRRVEAGGVPTIVDVEGGLSIGRSGTGCMAERYDARLQKNEKQMESTQVFKSIASYQR